MAIRTITAGSGITLTESVPSETLTVAASFLQAGTGAVSRNMQDKAREIVSPKDFGAAGDGATDDTAEIQAAIDASLHVDFGDNSLSYRITAALVLRSGQVIVGRGATITQATNDTEIFRTTSKSDIRISGLKLVGASNYTNSDSARDAGVWGDTSGSRIVVDHCYFLNFGYTAAKFKGQTDCHFTNNIVVGPGSPTLTAVTSGRNYGVLFDVGCLGCSAIGNSITKHAQGVRIEQVRDCRIVGNRIFDLVGQHGIYAGSGMTNVTISGNTIYNVDLIGIKVQSDDTTAVDNVGIVVDGNTVYDCGDQGIAIVSNTSAATFKNRGVTVSDNTIRLIASNGIYTDNTVGAVFSGNTIDLTTQSGIALDEVSEIQVVNNAIRRAALTAIRDIAASSYIRIAGNTIKDCATANTVGDEYGIYNQAGGSEWTIDGNVITDANTNMQYGIYIAANINATLTLTNNVVANATDCGLRLGNTAAMRAYKDNVWNGTTTPTFNDPVLQAVASATTITLPTAHDVISITGTTNIATINAYGHSGHTVTLIFAGILTVTDGSNLFLNGNFVTTADDCLTISCDGTNWYEVARSAN